MKLTTKIEKLQEKVDWKLYDCFGEQEEVQDKIDSSKSSKRKESLEKKYDKIQNRVENLEMIQSDCGEDVTEEEYNYWNNLYKNLDTPNCEVYFEATPEPTPKTKEVVNIITKDELFLVCCPMFNFELNAEQIVEKAIERKIIEKVDDNLFTITDSDYHCWVKQVQL